MFSCANGPTSPQEITLVLPGHAAAGCRAAEDLVRLGGNLTPLAQVYA